jgi:DNA-formamidopyrimidine glycosylase
MPEVAEVNIVRDFLEKYMAGCTILKISGKDESVEKLFDKKYTTIKSINKILKDETVKKVICKGKYLFIKFHSDLYLHSHLLMTGRWTVDNSKYLLKFSLMDGDDKKYIYYDGNFIFGKMAIYDRSEMIEVWNKLGPDVLHNNITLDHWKELIHKYRKRQVVSFLMNQECISGVGNYLKCEILYESRIKPDLKLSDLNDKQIKRLWKYTLSIPEKAYKCGGLTISDFLHPEGRMGTYPCKVYGRDYDPEGNDVIKSKFSDGRTTHWVSEIQF